MSSMGIRSLQLDSAKNGDRMAEIDFILEVSPRFEFFFFFFFLPSRWNFTFVFVTAHKCLFRSVSFYSMMPYHNPGSCFLFPIQKHFIAAL